MKKGSGILAFLTIFLSSLVSAGPVEGVEQLVEGLREVISIVVQFLSNVLFDLESFDEFFFAKLLILLILSLSSLFLSYKLEKKLCPKPTETREKYIDKQGTTRVRIIYTFTE